MAALTCLNDAIMIPAIGDAPSSVRPATRRRHRAVWHMTMLLVGASCAVLIRSIASSSGDDVGTSVPNSTSLRSESTAVSAPASMTSEIADVPGPAGPISETGGGASSLRSAPMEEPRDRSAIVSSGNTPSVFKPKKKKRSPKAEQQFGPMDIYMDISKKRAYAVASGTGGDAAKRGEIPEPFWIVLTAVDGIGNQMFQYSSALGMMLSNAGSQVGKTRQLRLCHHIRPDMSHQFLLPEAFVGPFTGPCPEGVAGPTCGPDCEHAHWEDGFATYTPLDLDGNDGAGTPYSQRPGAFVGRYLQSPKYFEGMEDTLREIFKFNEDIEPSGRVASGVEIVGIHAKSGDVLGYKDVPLPPDEYFERAMSYFEEEGRKRQVEVEFLLLPAKLEDETALRKFKSFVSRSNVHLARAGDEHDAGGGGGTAQDLKLMAMCDHIITTMGAFGWWAGWLAGGSVVYYRDLYGQIGKGGKNQVIPENHWPASWIGFGDEELGLGGRMEVAK